MNAASRNNASSTSFLRYNTAIRLLKERGSSDMSNKLKINIYAFITVFLWASAFPLTKIACRQFSPNSLGLTRCVIAAFLLIIMGMINHIRLPFCKKDIFYFLLSGGLGFALYMIFFNTGMLTLTSATSSIIIASTPIMTAIGASKLYKEKLSVAGWISIAMAFTGVIVLLLWNGILSVNIGVIWTLAAALVFCCYSLLNRKLSSMGYTALEIVTYSMTAGALLLMLFLPETLKTIESTDISCIAVAVYMGIMPSAVSYILWSKAMSLADRTNEVTNYMFVTPLLSTIMGFIMLNEIPDTGTFIGGAVIIASVIIFNLKG